jgi:SAM-dependent methyltransferase
MSRPKLDRLMGIDRNPQAEAMAHESMVRNLAAQMEAIWPQERLLFGRYALPETARILDVGCGTGETCLRLARELPRARILGIDVHEPHLEVARERTREFGERVEFRPGNAFDLDVEERSVDLALCRHMLQAVPQPERVLAEMARVTRRGGWLHLAAEDYGMIHASTSAFDSDGFFRAGPIAFGRSTGTDLYVGRRSYGWLSELGLDDVRVDYVTVDTVRVPRATLAEIFVAWRDGYSDIIAAHTRLSRSEVLAGFEAILACIRDPHGYVVWHLPIVSARVP